jgi:cellulose synthase/poly-beta-1,6-N-acetylglucosamine synthase-like glycosyltransferase
VLIIGLTTFLSLILILFYVGYFLAMHKAAKNRVNYSSTSTFSPFVSIIIPAYNEEKVIYEKLKNTFEQSYNNFEVIIANDGSDDETATKVKRFVTEHDFKNLSFLNFSQRRGKSYALTDAVFQSQGEIIVFTDADSILEQDAVKNIVKNFQHPGVGVVTGKLSMVNYAQSSSTQLEKDYRSVFDVIRLGESNIDSTPIINGALMAIRKELFDDVSDSVADDTEIAVRTREKGFRVIYEPAALVYSETPKDFRSRARQKIRSAQGIVESFAHHTKMMFNPAFGKYGYLIFPSNFFMHVIAPILVLIESILFFPFFVILAQIAPTVSIALVVVLLSVAILMVSGKLFGSALAPFRVFGVVFTILEHQLFLLSGFIFFVTRRKAVKWKKVDR